jgi:hypothetical protein
MRRHPRHLAPRRRSSVLRKALGGLAVVAVATLTTAGVHGFTDRANTVTDVQALHPECSTAVSSSSTDVVFGTGTFTGGWGVWAAGPWLCSPNAQWVAGFQTDGNFVAYNMASTPGAALWNSWTFGSHVGGRAESLRLRPNGDLVLTNAAGTVLRSSRTAGIATPATVALDDHGTLTVTDANGTVRFTSAGTDRLDCKTAGAFTCDPLTNWR